MEQEWANSVPCEAQLKFVEPEPHTAERAEPRDLPTPELYEYWACCRTAVPTAEIRVDLCGWRAHQPAMGSNSPDPLLQPHRQTVPGERDLTRPAPTERTTPSPPPRRTRTTLRKGSGCVRSQPPPTSGGRVLCQIMSAATSRRYLSRRAAGRCSGDRHGYPRDGSGRTGLGGSAARGTGRGARRFGRSGSQRDG